MFIVNSVDKTELSIYLQLIHKSVWRRGKYTAHLQSLPNRKKNEQLLTVSKLTFQLKDWHNSFIYQ